VNILIPHSWLKDYLKTQASPEKIAECLSLCGASVEQIKKVGKDKVYDIEITTNRVDMMSVSGIAREVAAILPQFGIKAEFTNDPYEIKSKVKSQKSKVKIDVVIKDKNLCPRFTAVVIDSVAVKPSPPKIKKRLEAASIRSLNNVIDISNYLMRSLGQPAHTFDYDKIKGHKMVLRQSKKGEKITTLDDKTHELPGGDIVIEDGSGALIDLCGIMGGENTAIDKNTKRVLLFIQTYNPINIRKTSMKLAHRTEAAQLFEKNIDPELVIPAIKQGVKLFESLAGGKPASKLYDIYPKPYKPKAIKVSLQFIEARLGTKLHSTKVKKALEALGFHVQYATSRQRFTIAVPSWRSHDVSIPEDIVEEVARIYGYHNLPSNLPKGALPKKLNNQTFYWEKRLKHLLKYLNFTETYTYSLQSKTLLKNFRLVPEEHLKLKNPLTKEWVFLRTSILPSLLEVAQKNTQFEKINLFELAKVYLPKKKGLPYEIQHLSLLSTSGFLKTKGIVEQIAKELNIKLDFRPHQKITQLSPEKTAIIKAKSFGEKNSSWEMVGTIGEVFEPTLKRFEIEKRLIAVDFNFDKLAALAKKFKKYQPIPKYPPIIEHLTFTNKSQVLASNILKTARKTHRLIKGVEIIDVYKNRLSLEITYQSRKKSLSDKEVGGIRKTLVRNLEKLGLKLRGKL